MKRLVIILLWLTPWFAGHTAAVPNVISKLERVQLFNHEYVRMEDWMKAAKFDLKWTRKDEEFQVASTWSRMTFTVNSSRTLLNGVTVWLSFPIALKNGDVFISPIDLQTAILPVLYPPANGAKQKILTVCIDAGHGGNDHGFEAGGEMEKKQTFLLAREVQRMLQDAGLKAPLVRADDTLIDVNERAELAKKRGGDLMVSVHFNSGPAGVRGVETYCMTPANASSFNAHGEGVESAQAGNQNNDKNMLLAWQLQKSITRGVEIEDRGVKRARFAVLKHAELPAVLIECGFMSDPGELKKIITASYRTNYARAIVDGILAYKKLVER